MNTVPTLCVKTSAADNPDGFCIINETDFDEAVHQLFEKHHSEPKPDNVKKAFVADAKEKDVALVDKPRRGRPPGTNPRPKPTSKVRGRRPKPNPQTVQPKLSIVREPPPEGWQTSIGMAQDTTY